MIPIQRCFYCIVLEYYLAFIKKKKIIIKKTIFSGVYFHFGGPNNRIKLSYGVQDSF